MKDERKKKKQLIDELITLRKLVAESEVSKDKHESHDDLLLKSGERFRYFVENANDIVYSLTPDGIFTYASPNWTEILGHDIHEVVGQSFESFVHPEDIPLCRAFLERVVATGKKQAGVEYRVRHKTGAWRWHTSNASPLRDADGNIISYMGISRDITERKRTEEELRENEGKYRSLYQEFRGILDAIPDGLLLLSPDLKIVWENEVAKSVHLEHSDISDPRCYHIKHGRSEPCESCVAPECLASGQPKVGESITPDGRIWELRFFPVFDDKGDAKGVIEVAHNITERKKAEEALRASENRYRTIFDTTGTTMLIVEEDMTISLVNHGFESLTGYKREEVEGKKKWTEFVEKGDLEKMITQHQLRRVDSGLAKKSYEFRLVHRDGRLKNIFLTVDLIPGTKKSVASLMDITDRRRAEEALRESEARYKLITDNMSDTVWLMDMDLKTTWCSPSVERSRGYSFEEIKALPMERHVTPASIEIILKTLSEELTPERLQQKDLNIFRELELEFYKKDGSTCWSEARFTLLRDPQGSPIGLLGVGRDITERKRVQGALRESEEKYRAIIENMQEGYHEVDLRGNFTFFNEATCKIIGYDREELLGMNNRQYADEENTRKVYQVYNRVYRTGEPVKNFEWQIIRKNGDRRDMEISISLIKDADNHPTGFRSVVRDTTDRKRADAQRREMEERLQRAEKMEVIGLLAGGVAHDLNNVLGVVIGYSEMLLMDANQSGSIRPSLVKIMNGGQKAAAIVQDLLALARRGVSGREVLNLNKIIAECRKSPEFEKLASYHPSVKIETDLDPRLFNVSGSSVHLGKTLFNLVSNASEAMPRGGILTIKTANQYLAEPIQGYDEVREGDYVVLSVSDTGEGIAAADLKRIFEPFYTKKVMGRSGTGLGLAVVWGTVKDHRGYINVESEEGKGSVFTIYFPVTREDISAEAAAISMSEYMGKGESILVVDDVEEQRDLAAGMLRKLNYNVTTVSSGEEAIAYLKEHQADLMVLDMIMDPGIDGLDTYRNILKIHQKQKAIIVSGFSETARVITTQALGAGAYIRKPYVIEKLGFAVRRELDRK
jgi:PAS domain S-box-containing protein